VIDAVGSGGLLLVIDQWSKRAVRQNPRGWSTSRGRLRVRYVENAHHPRARANPMLLVLGWCAALVSAIVLHRAGGWFSGRVPLIGLGLALGGAAGNLLDLLRFRGVVDFIDLGWWPMFNVADVAIVGGLVAAFWP
jgi:lipoprotein signal peptidase